MKESYVPGKPKQKGKMQCTFLFFFLFNGLLSFLQVALPFVVTGQRTKVAFYRLLCLSVSFEVSCQLKYVAMLVDSLMPCQTWRGVSPQIRLCWKWSRKKELGSALCWKATPIRERVTGLKCTWGGSETRCRSTLLHSASPAYCRLIAISEHHCFHFGD